MSIDFALSLMKKSEHVRKFPHCVGASSLGMCGRRIGYSLLSFPAMDAPAHLAFILDLGNAIHDMVQRRLVSMGWIKARPVLNQNGDLDWEQLPEFPASGCEIRAVDEKRRISGFCDGVTVPLIKTTKNGITSYEPNENGKVYMVEIKSITDRPNFFVLGIRDGGTQPISEENCPSEFINLDVQSSKNGKNKQKLYTFQHSRKVFCKVGGPRMLPVYKVKIDGKDELITVLMIGNTQGQFSALTKPKPEHILQASSYSTILSQKLGVEINDILFLYVGKDVSGLSYDEDSPLNVPVKLFETPVDPTTTDLVDIKLSDIFSCTDNGTLPEKEFTPDTWECRGCPYVWHCYPESLPEDVVEAMKERTQ